jgi:hypothetical protein
MSRALRLAWIVAALTALAGCATVHPTATSARDWLVQYRTGHGLTPVSLDPRLTALAKAQADAMAANDTLSHDVGGSFTSRTKGLDYGRIAENVAYGAATEKGVMEQWQRSPPHDANMLMPEATHFGIASARSSGGKPKIYWAMAIATDPPEPVTVMPSDGPVVTRRVVRHGESSVASIITAPFASLFGE